jgi:competence protein ComEC
LIWPLALAAAGWSVGVCTGVVVAPDHPDFAAAALAGAVISAGLALVLRPPVLPLLAAAALLGLARAEAEIGDPGERLRAENAAGSMVAIEGRIADEPRFTPAGYELLVEPSRIDSDHGQLASLGRVLVRVRGTGEPALDDEVRATGRLRLPLDRPGFDRRAYLAQKHSHLELAQAQLRVVSHADGVRGLPGRLRAGYRAALQELLPAPHAALLMGVVLGIRTGIPPRLEQDMIATGLVHLLVLSGLKVAVFARLATAAIRPLLRRAATLPTLALIGLYALVGGGTPAAVRAAAMGGLVLLALHLGRPAHVWTSLSMVAAAMLAWQPALAWDVGFQLSFVGTAAIILLTPPLEARLGWLPAWFREPFAVTCAAQIGTVPLMATDFHLLSPIAPLANAAVLPALPALIGAGLLIAPLAALPEIGRPLVLPVVGLLAYMEQVATLLARLPGGALGVARMPAGAGAAYYAGLAGVIAWFQGTRRVRHAGMVAALAGPLLIGVIELAAWSRSPPTVSILAVGEGQAVLLNGPGGAVLVDGGPSPARLSDELGQRLPPWSRRLSGLALTGPGLGHVGGLAGFEREVDQVLLPATPLPGGAWRAAALAAQARGAHLRRLTAGERFRLAGLDFNVLAPSDPESGLALQVRRPGGRSFCDLGDLDLAGQVQAAARLQGGCDYLLLPGGGRSAPAPELMAAARPSKMIASVGGGRLSRELPPTVLRTDQEGSIELRL